MKRLQFQIEIKAPAKHVYRTMLGLDDIKSYEGWTAPFNPTSTYKGTWEKGSKIYFIGTSDDGKQGGMVSEIAENIPNSFVSIRHYGVLRDGKEITSGPEAEQWAGGMENYTFKQNENGTTVIVDTDASEEFLGYFDTTFPKALEKLKDLAENAG